MSEQLLRSVGVAMRKNNIATGEQTVPKVTTNFSAGVVRPAHVGALPRCVLAVAATQQLAGSEGVSGDAMLALCCGVAPQMAFAMALFMEPRDSVR
ncbi:MAG: hypothetical protein ACRC1O_18025 [Ralstonia mannitolilytica]|uniref:hypothetical protein n=1 Tax=Ralstonia mannitolilytica TaxID=105219 RepID=UPI0012FD0F55|nr:hypothetical protein [Ralstonia mannitolilytica]QIF09434.1 hypothetical protein G5A69_17815 [Ralstonia mannitolilytica]